MKNKPINASQKIVALLSLFAALLWITSSGSLSTFDGNISEKIGMREFVSAIDTGLPGSGLPGIDFSSF